MASVSDLALSNLALRFANVGFPPILLVDRLALLILLVRVGAIILLVMLSCSPKSRSGDDVKVISKHSRNGPSFQYLWNPWSDQQSSERHREGHPCGMPRLRAFCLVA